MATQIKVPIAKNVREWFAFYGGEELNISLENASVVWDAATKAQSEIINKKINAIIDDYVISDDAAMPSRMAAFIHKLLELLTPEQ